MTKLRSIVVLLFLCGCYMNTFANNLKIDNVSLQNDSTITFTISWDNSWNSQYAPGNHDAVWIFIKKRDCASLQWSHVDLSKNMSDHTAASPLMVDYDGKDVGTNAKGVYVRRADIGGGAINQVSVTLRMKGQVSGEFDFKIFGTEMVYVPQGAFYLGDGSSADVGFALRSASGEAPYLISSEAAVPTTTTSSQSGYNRLYSSSVNVNSSTLAAAYPKGYNAFYCMKYEITQGQYVDFLNCIQADQAQARYRANTNEYGISYMGSWPEIYSDFPYRAAGFLSWYDLLAYLDWACLRPMSELEFEKVARGPVMAIANEYAWGTSVVSPVDSVAAPGTIMEVATNGATASGGLANINNKLGHPLRSGFAAKPGTTRFSSGAGYYGAMELTGNVFENCVNINTNGRTYTGLVGDGEITTSVAAITGIANVTGWPQTATSKIARGGSFTDTNARSRLACRAHSSANYLSAPPDARYNVMGGRGVR